MIRCNCIANKIAGDLANKKIPTDGLTRWRTCLRTLKIQLQTNIDFILYRWDVWWLWFLHLFDFKLMADKLDDYYIEICIHFVYGHSLTDLCEEESRIQIFSTVSCFHHGTMFVTVSKFCWILLFILWCIIDIFIL